MLLFPAAVKPGMRSPGRREQLEYLTSRSFSSPEQDDRSTNRVESPAITPRSYSVATKFLQENQHKRSIEDDALHLRQLDPFIGAIPLRQVHMGALQEFIGKRGGDGVKTKSINAASALVRRVLNLASSEWIDDRGMTWLEAAPKIRLFPVTDARPPYPLSTEEQTFLFQELPDHLARMALFKGLTAGPLAWVTHRRTRIKTGNALQDGSPVHNTAPRPIWGWV